MWFAAVFVISILTVVVQGQSKFDYCSPTLCNGRTHIACKNDGSFSSTCKSGREIVNIASFQERILNKHNAYRNQVAGGSLPGFSPAVRMATIQWDPELAKLAELNVKQCAMRHDQCRNTARFKWAGQNLAWQYGIPAPKIQDVIDGGIQSWFSEYKYASQEHIDSYHSSSRGVIGHFTGMINDRNTHIGCAVLKQPRDSGVEFFFACDYSQTNILDRAIYVKGPTASKCTTGKNAQFPNLCSPSEPIDPNYIP